MILNTPCCFKVKWGAVCSLMKTHRHKRLIFNPYLSGSGVICFGLNILSFKAIYLSGCAPKIF